jgi:DNA-binding transcriptional LysR family regulator
MDSRADITMLVAGGAPLDGEFIARRVARATAVLCASPEYLKRHGRPQHPRELAQHKVLVASLPGLPSRFELVRADGGESQSLELSEGSFASPHPDVMVAAARAGMGIGAALSLSLANALQRGDVERVLPDWRLEDWSVYACYPSRQHLPKSVRAFLEHLSARYPDPSADPWLPPRAQRSADTRARADATALTGQAPAAAAAAVAATT